MNKPLDRSEPCSAPHPTLAQLAKQLLERIWDGVPCTKHEIEAAILTVLSPEWERMVWEKDEARGSVYRCKQIEITALVRDLAALRSENERLTKERDGLLRDLTRIADGCEVRCPDREEAINRIIALRTRLRELEEDKADLDWIEANGHELHLTCWKATGAMSNPWTVHRGDFAETEPIGEAQAFRDAIRAARKRETQP